MLLWKWISFKSCWSLSCYWHLLPDTQGPLRRLKGSDEEDWMREKPCFKSRHTTTGSRTTKWLFNVTGAPHRFISPFCQCGAGAVNRKLIQHTFPDNNSVKLLLARLYEPSCFWTLKWYMHSWSFCTCIKEAARNRTTLSLYLFVPFPF